MCFVNHASSKCDCWKVIECSDWDVWKLMLGRLWRMTVYLPLDWCIFTEILNTKGRFWTSLRNSCLSVIKIVLDSMLYETLKWSQISPFCISSKKKFRRGGRPRPTPVQNYGVLTIKPQLRPWRQFWTNHTIFIRPKKTWLWVLILSDNC